MLLSDRLHLPLLAKPRPQLIPRRAGSSSSTPRRPFRQLHPGQAAAAAAMVQYIESERVSAKGKKLLSVAYLPDAAAGPPLAVLCFHHGMAEHVGRYKTIFERFADQGIAVYSGDIVGHGKSEGVRVYMESYVAAVDEFAAACDYAVQDVQQRYAGAPPPPVFVAGHSMGGLVAALTAARDQGRWAGLMVLSAALDVEMSPLLRIQAAMGSLLATLVPKARIVPAVDIKGLNPDPKLVQAYIDDPLNTVGPIPARTAFEALKGMKALRALWPTFKLPLYFHHGEADKITSPHGAQAFYAAAASTDKTFKLVPGGYHEVLFTAGVGEELLGGMIEWIKQRATGGGTAKM